MSYQFDLVVASHLRWNFVWQRPQQVLSRLARNHRILFVEEPVYSDNPNRNPLIEVAGPNITVLAPQLHHSQRDETSAWEPREEICAQVETAIEALNFGRRALWHYTPVPSYMAEAVKPTVMVYDVMDELANFKFAPPNLKDEERKLLRRSDVVFTGGASMFEAKRSFNENTHLFASGVDAVHYSKACLEETEVPEWMEALPRPRATYFGVIDERLDYDLISRMVSERPDIQFVMVGPVVKVDPAELPKAPNLYYAGQQPYEALPRILKGTDVCLMPFALNDATKFISPTKTLEYMATHKPIVSTPIRDVVRFYSDICHICHHNEDIVRQIEKALNETAEERSHKKRLEEEILARNSWDSIAANMDSLMTAAFARNLARTSVRGDIHIAPNRTQVGQQERAAGNGIAARPIAGGGQ